MQACTSSHYKKKMIEADIFSKYEWKDEFEVLLQANLMNVPLPAFSFIFCMTSPG
jgi:hypothetical protein